MHPEQVVHGYLRWTWHARRIPGRRNPTVRAFSNPARSVLGGNILQSRRENRGTGWLDRQRAAHAVDSDRQTNGRHYSRRASHHVKAHTGRLNAIAYTAIAIGPSSPANRAATTVIGPTTAVDAHAVRG